MAFDAQAAAASQYRKADPTLDDHLQNLSSVFAQQYSPLEYAACSLAHALWPCCAPTTVRADGWHGVYCHLDTRYMFKAVVLRLANVETTVGIDDTGRPSLVQRLNDLEQQVGHWAVAGLAAANQIQG